MVIAPGDRFSRSTADAQQAHRTHPAGPSILDPDTEGAP